jgi:predicted acyltransferase
MNQSQATREATSQRIHSLDQFRGYTVIGMFVVNFIGGFAAVHWIFKHHNTFCSYADTIMPQFFFAVGFAYRLTMLRRVEQLGAWQAYLRVVRRLLGLVLISLVIYTADRPAQRWSELVELGFWGAIQDPLKRDWFQTLMHIAATSLWVLPVVRASARVRILFLIVSAAAHLILSHWFYFAWVNNGHPNGIDGGPLGFLTWTIPVIVGTLSADPFLVKKEGVVRLRSLVLWATVLMLLGYALSCPTRFYDVDPASENPRFPSRIAAQPVVPPASARTRAWSDFTGGDPFRLLAEPPFCPPPHRHGRISSSYQLRQWNYWMMSQRGGTLSYLVFASGFSLAVFLAMHVLCDRWGWQSRIFRTFGTNALVAYVLHMMVADAVLRFMPRDAPGWYIWSGCGLFLLITYVLVRALERQGVYIRV